MADPGPTDPSDQYDPFSGPPMVPRFSFGSLAAGYGAFGERTNSPTPSAPSVIPPEASAKSGKENIPPSSSQDNWGWVPRRGFASPAGSDEFPPDFPSSPPTFYRATGPAGSGNGSSLSTLRIDHLRSIPSSVAQPEQVANDEPVQATPGHSQTHHTGSYTVTTRQSIPAHDDTLSLFSGMTLERVGPRADDFQNQMTGPPNSLPKFLNTTETAPTASQSAQRYPRRALQAPKDTYTLAEVRWLMKYAQRHSVNKHNVDAWAECATAFNESFEGNRTPNALRKKVLALKKVQDYTYEVLQEPVTAGGSWNTTGTGNPDEIAMDLDG